MRAQLFYFKKCISHYNSAFVIYVSISENMVCLSNRELIVQPNNIEQRIQILNFLVTLSFLSSGSLSLPLSLLSRCFPYQTLFIYLLSASNYKVRNVLLAGIRKRTRCVVFSTITTVWVWTTL